MSTIQPELASLRIGERLTSGDKDIRLEVTQIDLSECSITTKVVGLKHGWPRDAYDRNQVLIFTPAREPAHWVEHPVGYHPHKPFASVLILKGERKELTNSLAIMAAEGL